MMRMVITGMMLLGLATPCLAAKVYLKDGGVIDAKSVRRSEGKVQVLVNRDTLVTFLPAEIDQKRTFPSHHRAVKKRPHVAVQQQKGAVVPVAAVAPVEAPAAKKTSWKSFSLPSLPTLPSKLPEMSPPSLGGKEGTIRKQKREMQERLNE